MKKYLINHHGERFFCKEHLSIIWPSVISTDNWQKYLCILLQLTFLFTVKATQTTLTLLVLITYAGTPSSYYAAGQNLLLAMQRPPIPFAIFNSGLHR